MGQLAGSFVAPGSMCPQFPQLHRWKAKPMLYMVVQLEKLGDKVKEAAKVSEIKILLY